jgi:hypothetical protein
MKKLVSLSALALTTVLSTAAFAGTFPCPTVDQVTFTKQNNGNGGVTLYAEANPTTNMPSELGKWMGTKNTFDYTPVGAPIQFQGLSNLPGVPNCNFAFQADFNNQPITIIIPVSPNGSEANKYIYTGTATAIRAEPYGPPT